MRGLAKAQSERMASLLKTFMEAVDAGDLSAYVPIDPPGAQGRKSYNMTATSGAGNRVCIDLQGAGFVFSHGGQCYA